MSYWKQRIISFIVITIVFIFIFYGHLQYLIESSDLYSAFPNELYQMQLQGAIIVVEIIILLYVACVGLLDLIIFLYNNSYHKSRVYLVFVLSLTAVITGIVSYYVYQFRYDLNLSKQLYYWIVYNFLLLTLVFGSIRMLYKRFSQNNNT